MDWLFQYADPSIDWDYAMITLIVRFIGVFFVMLAMQVALQVSSRVVQRIEAKETAGVGATSQAPPAGAPPPAPAVAAVEDDLDEITAAAIGAALAMETRAPAGRANAGDASAWAVAGRLQQLNRLPR